MKIACKIEPVKGRDGVCVRELSGAEADGFEQTRLTLAEKLANGSAADKAAAISAIRRALVALCACDDKGAALFDVADDPELTGSSTHGIRDIFEAATKLNKMGAEEAKETAENFTPAAGKPSGPSSPGTSGNPT